MTTLVPDTIRGRLIVTFISLFAIVAILLTLFVVQQAEQAANDRADKSYLEQADLVASALSGNSNSGTELQQQVDRLAAGSKRDILLLNANDELVASSVPREAVPSIEALTGFSMAPGSIYAITGDWRVAVADVPDQSGNRVVLIATAGDLETRSEAVWRPAVLGLLVALGFVGVLTWGVSNRIASPLEQLREQVAAVTSGNLTVRVPQDGVRDLRDLAGAFNVMTLRIRELISESEAARQELELIFDNLREGVLVVDSHERIVARNRRASEILGSGQEWERSSMPFISVARDHDLLELLRATMRDGFGSTVPIDHARSGLSIEATAIPVYRDHEQLIIIVLRDVTEIRRLEVVRREFVANVSHELRTPLASIRALAETLEAGAIDDPEVSQDFIMRITQEVDRLTALVDELLDLARLESGRITLQRQAIAPAELIEVGVDRLRPQIDRAGLELELDISAALPFVSADRVRIEQVLLNLVHNAIKFTTPGGQIRIVAKRTNGTVQIDVQDTGQGIPEAELPRVFERFYKADRSRRSEGTGLGLAISKHIILAHQGEIWVTSAAGKGSTFSFSLPVATQAVGPRTVG